MKHCLINNEERCLVFREDMVRKWKNLDDESRNTSAQQFLLLVGRGKKLGIAVMRSLFHQQNQFSCNMKIHLVHILNDMDEVLNMDLN
jgi:hypothetical protein